MLQKPLPLLLLLPPWDTRWQPSGPRLPIRTLFTLSDRVAASFFPKAPLAQIPWLQPRGKKKSGPHSRHYAQAVNGRLAQLAATPGLQAGVQLSVSALPLETARGEASLSGKLALYNHGDDYGEDRGEGGPVTCPAGTARDLRDLAAARLADWPGSVLFNEGLAADAFITSRRRADGLPWVHLEFSQHLFMKPDGTLYAKRVKDFADRLETVLTLWCRLQSW